MDGTESLKKTCISVSNARIHFLNYKGLAKEYCNAIADVTLKTVSTTVKQQFCLKRLSGILLQIFVFNIFFFLTSKKIK